MNLGTPFSLLLIAAGAILRWGVEGRVDNLNLPVIGLILMVVGAIGLVLSIAFWGALFGSRDRTVVVHDNPRVIDRDIDHEPGVRR